MTPVSPTGLLLIDKPEGPTSMDVCRAVRRRLVAAGAPRRVKVGHAGTLDPLATGLLVVLVGKATRLSDRYMAGEKRYLADVDLSRTSATDDREGPVRAVDVPSPPALDAVRALLPRFVGTILQVPPAFSAIKVEGRRAYRLARKDRAPTLAPRPVVIHAIDVVAYAWPLLRLGVRCGKGVYIRSLARDLGAALGVGGMLQALRRTRVGPFELERATPLDALPPLLTGHDLLPIDPDGHAQAAGG